MTDSKKAAAAKKANTTKADSNTEVPAAAVGNKAEATPQVKPADDSGLNKPRMQPALAVTSVDPKGYRRIGRRFTHEPTMLTHEDLDQETAELLMADNGLRVEPAEVPVEEDTKE